MADETTTPAAETAAPEKKGKGAPAAETAAEELALETLKHDVDNTLKNGFIAILMTGDPKMPMAVEARLRRVVRDVDRFDIACERLVRAGSPLAALLDCKTKTFVREGDANWNAGLERVNRKMREAEIRNQTATDSNAMIAKILIDALGKKATA